MIELHYKSTVATSPCVKLMFVALLVVAARQSTKRNHRLEKEAALLLFEAAAQLPINAIETSNQSDRLSKIFIFTTCTHGQRTVTKQWWRRHRELPLSRGMLSVHMSISDSRFRGSLKCIHTVTHLRSLTFIRFINQSHTDGQMIWA